MKPRILPWVLLGIAVMALGVTGYQAWKWKKVADTRGYLAEQTAGYVFGNTRLVGPDGTPVRRADLLDALIADAIHQHRLQVH